MKKILTIAFIAITSIACAQLPGIDKPWNETAEREAQAHQSNFLFQSTGVGENYDLKYHRFEWNVDPAVRYISGVVTSYFIPVTSLFSSMSFDCSDSLVVDSVLYHHQKISTSRPGNNVLTATFAGSLPQNILDSVSVYYRGVPPSRPGDFTQPFSIGTHGNNIPVLWTLSEPYGARDWWPCKQDLNDKIDSIDVIVTCPSQYRVGSNGLLISEILNGSNKTYHWKHRYPIAAYLIAIAATNYSVYSDYVPMGSDSLQMLNYVYPENLSSAKTGTHALINVVQLYDSLFGDYGFKKEKYGHAQFGWGGGQEHQTMTYVINFGNELLSHECAHQWFGDKVTCGTWADIWLNEGFATWLEGLTHEHHLGSISWETWKSSNISSATSRPNGSVFVTDTTDPFRIFSGYLSYAKAGMLLHMLRFQLGDTAMFRAIYEYINDPHLAYSYARTSDLKAHLESASGKNLTEFLNDWFYGQGYPTYHTVWSQEADNTVTVTLSQTQSHSSVPFFEMKVPIKFTSGSGKDTTLVFNNTSSGQTFTAKLSFKATSAQFDPDRWILTGNNSIGVSVDDERDASTLKMETYPNPARDNLTVLFRRDVDGSLSLVDMLGRAVRTVALHHEPEVHISLRDLPAGLYTAILHTSEGEFTKKVVKE